MDHELQGAISVLTKKVDQKTKELAEMKRLVNSLCRESGQEPIYPEAETVASGAGIGSIRADQFYGKSPITAAREYLEMRGKAVPLDDVYQGLIQGGFDFDAQGWGESVRLRNLSISLGKNTAIFHRLPNDTIGLLKWYPEAKQRKAAAKGQSDADRAAKGGTDAEEVKAEPANNA